MQLTSRPQVEDSEIAGGLAAREGRRRPAAEVVRRIAPARTRRHGRWTHQLLTDSPSALASFESYDALARAGHRKEEIMAVITHLARIVFGLHRS